MSIIFLLLCGIGTMLQGISSDKEISYIQGLCRDIEDFTQRGDFEFAFHYGDTALKYYNMRKINNIETLCHVWTVFGKSHFKKWMLHRQTADLARASNFFKKAMMFQHSPATEAFGLLAMACENFQEAICYLTAAIKEKNNKIENYRHLASCYENIGDIHSAIHCYSQIVLLGDKSVLRLIQHLYDMDNIYA